MAGPQPRVHEIDLLVPSLYFLSQHREGADTTTRREYLENLFQPSDVNAEPVGGPGSRMTRFSQIARNAVSNQAHGKNIIAQGYATYADTTRLTTITERGLELLRQIGYTV